MLILDKISGYFKQFAGEVTGSHATYDEGRRDVANAERKSDRDAAPYQEKDEQVVPVELRTVPGETGVVSAESGAEKVVHADAVPQLEVSQAGRTNDGVSSAKPRVITGSDDATIHRAAPGRERGADWSVGFDETAPRADTDAGRPADSLVHPVGDPHVGAPYGGTPHATADVEQLKLYRLVPIAAPGDTNWDNAPNQGEVVVRARSTGDARVVAAEAELDFMEIDALPADGNSTTSASAFRNERLYTVVDETDGRFPADGPREVVDGIVRVDNIRPTQV
jgi:uncharacterized protein YjbJ (UPF0337 family)